MNKAFRIIWSHTHQAFVVANELASTRGKRSSTRLLLAAASASLLAAVPGMAQAANQCGGASLFTINSSMGRVLCEIENSSGLTVTSTGSIDAQIIARNSFDTIRNFGTINGDPNGITLSPDWSFSVTDRTATAIRNETGAVITSGEYAGIDIGNWTVGSVLNQGSISSTDSFAIRLAGSNVTGSIHNDVGAILDGSEGGIKLEQGATVSEIRNDGQISASYGYGNGIYIEDSSHVDTITNTGTIRGYSDYGYSGINVYSSSIDTIDNSGTISGDHGIDISASNVGTVNNSSRIEGSTYAIYVSDDSTLSNLNLIGTQARLIGDVYGLNTNVTVKSGAVFSNENAFQVRSFTVESGAVFNFGQGLHATGGMSTDGITVSQGFQNSGTVIIAAGTTATIHGDYTQTSNGTLKIGALNDSTYGKLVVDGTATLPSNAKIVVDVTNPNFRFSTNRLQSVISAGTLISDGTFSVSGNSLLFNFNGVKNGNAVDLVLSSSTTASVLSSVHSTGNTPAQGAASTLDRIIANDPNGELANHFVGLTNQQQVSNAVTSTQPTAAGSAGNATNSALSGINRVIQARQESNSGLSSGNATADSNFWMKAFGSWANQGQRNGISGYDADTAGFAIGADAAVTSQSRFGLSFAYAKTKVDNTSSIAPQDVQIDTYQLIGYGSRTLSPDTELNFQVDFGQNRNQSKRYMSFANASAKATYDGYNAHLGLGVGHNMQLSERLTFIPSVRGDYTWIGTRSYKETGAGALNLNVDSNSAEQLLVSFDGKFNYKLSDVTVLSANLGAGYDLIGEKSSITSAYAGAPGATFKTPGMEMERWVARGGLGLTHALANGTEINLRYDVETRSGFLSQGASVKARWVF